MIIMPGKLYTSDSNEHIHAWFYQLPFMEIMRERFHCACLVREIEQIDIAHNHIEIIKNVFKPKNIYHYPVLTLGTHKNYQKYTYFIKFYNFLFWVLLFNGLTIWIIAAVVTWAVSWFFSFVASYKHVLVLELSEELRKTNNLKNDRFYNFSNS